MIKKNRSSSGRGALSSNLSPTGIPCGKKRNWTLKIHVQCNPFIARMDHLRVLLKNWNVKMLRETLINSLYHNLFITYTATRCKAVKSEVLNSQKIKRNNYVCRKVPPQCNRSHYSCIAQIQSYHQLSVIAACNTNLTIVNTHLQLLPKSTKPNQMFARQSHH